MILQTPVGPMESCTLERFAEMIPAEEFPFNEMQAKKDRTNRVRTIGYNLIERELQLTPLQRFQLAYDLRVELLAVREIDLTHLEDGREIISEAVIESMMEMGHPTNYSFYDGYLYILSSEYFKLFFAVDKANLTFFAKIALLSPRKVIRVKIDKFSLSDPR